MKTNTPTKSQTDAWEFTLPSARLPAMPKFDLRTILALTIVGGFVVNQILILRMKTPAEGVAASSSPSKLTAFDTELIKDKNLKIGSLNSIHNHADMKVFVNGTAMNFAKPEYYMKSSFLHVDSNQNADDSSSVLHLHAKNTPMWVFFKSIGMNLASDSLTQADGKILKNENGNSLKFYLNGKKVDELTEYVIQPLDKLLISYGPENDPNIDRQIASVTDFAKDHQK